MIRKKKIAVLMGGYGNEREVSLRSGANVYNELKSANYLVEQINVGDDLIERLRQVKPDIAYNMLHGTFGEDGNVQAILKFLHIPYTGENVLNSAIAFHKYKTKELLRRFVPMASDVYLGEYSQRSDKKNEVAEILAWILQHDITYPFFLKKTESGSSIGVFKIDDEVSWQRVYREERLATCLSAYYVEEALAGREVTVGLFRELNTELKAEVRVLPILELEVLKGSFYDYNAKYTKGRTNLIVPTHLPIEVQKTLEQMALKIWNLYGFRSCVRCDFILQGKDLTPHVLEINTQPGMTETSDIPAMLKAANITVRHFIEQMLWNALFFSTPAEAY